MDRKLKRDLKGVRDNIKSGIKDVIGRLEVEKLDEKVMKDLGKLKSRIEGLASEVNGGTDSNGKIISKELAELKRHKGTLDEEHVNKIKSAESELAGKFKNNIQDPLGTAVGAVGTAIGELGGTFENGKLETIARIFEHIKGEVGKIKGTPGRNPNGNDGTGLEGVVQRVKGLARAFVNPAGKGFEARVVGWLQNSILGNGKQSWEREYKPGMQAVNTWLEPYQKAAKGGGHNEQALKDQVINNIKSALGTQITAAQRMIMSVQNGITVNLTAIVTACNTFVEELDKKITKGAIDQLANPVAGQIQNWMQGQGLWNRVTDADLKCAVRYTLLALCAGVKQVATEIKSLGTDKFGEILDTIKPIVDKLHNNLDLATQTSATSTESPAQAVDGKLEDVKSKVAGLEEDFRGNVTRVLRDTAG
ncbi:Extracellular matrix-binding ebh, putative [Babesia ovata]|uniref:Extracellular matrix-binding ebh, putative n=1 Tax=Babesia ovata TaxID=189622 RepID=A0A2H6K7Z1_9APIC|nr:Extracellular matrix-binding ebh, putative [Babesia ovata]GBE59104.1 Extracellular matrix-binding ebh, putative [Babesia ovata]